MSSCHSCNIIISRVLLFELCPGLPVDHHFILYDACVAKDYEKPATHASHEFPKFAIRFKTLS